MRTPGSISDGPDEQYVDDDDAQTAVADSNTAADQRTLGEEEHTEVVTSSPASEHTTSIRSSADDSDDVDDDHTDLADDESPDLPANNHTGVYHADDEGKSFTEEDYEAMTKPVESDRAFWVDRRQENPRTVSQLSNATAGFAARCCALKQLTKWYWTASRTTINH